ncbi:MAG TPA: hypothetical protein VN889_08115 [Solirubrobacteraceae bacterium]|nr:hypothetical protein [Solirubrobacteraceae bacterium]
MRTGRTILCCAAIAAGVVLPGPAADASGEPFARSNSTAVFRDNVQSYTTTEPAIDLTASSPLAFSWQVSAPAPLPR